VFFRNPLFFKDLRKNAWPFLFRSAARLPGLDAQI